RSPGGADRSCGGRVLEVVESWLPVPAASGQSPPLRPSRRSPAVARVAPGTASALRARNGTVAAPAAWGCPEIRYAPGARYRPAPRDPWGGRGLGSAPGPERPYWGTRARLPGATAREPARVPGGRSTPRRAPSSTAPGPRYARYPGDDAARADAARR